MTIKILFILSIIILSINNVYAYEIFEGQVESTAHSQTTHSIGFTSSAPYEFNCIGIVNGDIAKDLTTASVQFDYNAWSGYTELAYMKGDVVYKQLGDTVGTGYLYYWLQNTDSIPGYDEVYIKLHFDDGLDIPSGNQRVDIVGSITSYTGFSKSNSLGLHNLVLEKQVVIGKPATGAGMMQGVNGVHKSWHTIHFLNNYSYWYDNSLYNFELERDNDNPSILLIDNSYQELINETDYTTTSCNIYSDDLTNHTWDIQIYDINDINHIFQIDLNPDPIDTTPTLSFNQSTYYINETMEFEYSNLDYLYTYDKFYDLVFYYYTSEDSIEYLYIQPLNDYDNTGYLSTTGWTPKKLYYGVIDNSLNYKTSNTLFLNNVKLSNHMILTYDYEFIYISCEGSYCQYENGNSFVITYNSFGNYTLNVKDNSSTIIQSLGNINGFGTIGYTIPYDNQKQYTYPYWNISFNESYENVIVFWSIEEDEINYQDDVVNESIQANINEMKEGIKPLFDLAFGLSTIIVENPDYDNNGVMSSSELDRWFNSIISIVILLALYIFYNGLKDRGSK